MAGTQCLLATAMAVWLTNVSGTGKPDVFGIVARADRASLDSAAVSEGTTVYDGDRLSTETGGALRLQVGEAMLDLAGQTSVIVHNNGNGVPKEFEAELISGGAVLSLRTGNATGEIVARSARVRPISETRGIVGVRLLGPHDLIVFAERGPAEISYGGESETIPEGKSYRVLLNAEQDGTGKDPAPKKAGKGRKALLVIAIGAGTAGIITPLVMGLGGGTQKGVESPDRP